MRSLVLSIFVLSSFVALGCDSGGGDGAEESGESASAALEGEWRVINEDGVENGQVVTITSDHVSMSTLGSTILSEDDIEFRREGDNVQGDWLGADLVFSDIAEGQATMTWGSMVVTLVR